MFNTDYLTTPISAEEFYTPLGTTDIDQSFEGVSSERLHSWLLDECDMDSEEVDMLLDAGWSIEELAQEKIQLGFTPPSTN